LFSKLNKIEIPHVFVILIIIIFICSLFSYFIPSGSFDRETKKIGNRDRTIIVPNSYKPLEKEISLKGIFLGSSSENKVQPVSLTGFISAIPRGLENSADIVFFIFILGGVFGILQRTGTIIAFLQALMKRFNKSAPLLTSLLMLSVAVGGSTLGMGEEFIPLVPIFIMLATKLGYDPIYGLSMVMLAADVGFAAATFNPFTVGIASGIAEVTLGNDFWFRVIFFSIIFLVTLTYVLRYGAIIKRNPSKSLMKNQISSQNIEVVETIALNKQHILTIIIGFIIFAFIIYASVNLDWWFNEMAGGFFLIGLFAVIICRLSLKVAASAFVKGMEDMVVAALVVGFARGIVVVLDEGYILDTIIYSASLILQNFHDVVAANGMLVFQTFLNFFIPSGSGQAAVTMPLMAPLSDVLGISRTTAIFAFTCGDGFSNIIIPTSGILMAMLSLAKIPYQVWLKFVFPLFVILMAISIIFLSISVYIHT
jgi:uncharacterized ion transporter superfamily protein YfcC